MSKLIDLAVSIFVVAMIVFALKFIFGDTFTAAAIVEAAK